MGQGARQGHIALARQGYGVFAFAFAGFAALGLSLCVHGAYLGDRRCAYMAHTKVTDS